MTQKITFNVFFRLADTQRPPHRPSNSEKTNIVVMKIQPRYMMHFALFLALLMALITMVDVFQYPLNTPFMRKRFIYSIAQTVAVKQPRIEIEYCPGCKWMLRSAWYAQELLTTFEEFIGEVALIPSKESGTFKIRVDSKDVWDRRQESTKGFPEIKTLKQIIRDIVASEKDLGHSDNK